MEAKNQKYDLLISDVVEISSNGSEGITLVYLLKGSLLLKYRGHDSVLNSGSVILFNNNEAYQLFGKEKNILILLEIPKSYFVRNNNRLYLSHFTLNSLQQPGYKETFVDKIKEELSSMLIAFIKNNIDSYTLEMDSCLCEILLLLIRYFKDKTIVIENSSASYSKRIKNVTSWIENNYQCPISLTDMANKEYVSIAHLSRIFKHEVGINFKQYLTEVRFRHSVQQLINTADSVNTISLNNGFSSVRQFIELFKERYKKTPRQFRQAYHRDEFKLPINISNMSCRDVREVNLAEVFELLTANPDPEQYSKLSKFCQSEVLDIDLALCQSMRTYVDSPRQYIAMIGSLEEILRETTQKQIMRVKHDIGLNYVDIFNSVFDHPVPDIFSLEDKTFNTVCYSILERAISFLKQAEIALFVRINKKVKISEIDDFLRYGVNVFGRTYLQQWCFIYDFDHEKTGYEVESEFQDIRKRFDFWIGKVKFGIIFPLSDGASAPVSEYAGIFKLIDFIGYRAIYPQSPCRADFNDNFFSQSEHFISDTTAVVQNMMHTLKINIPLYLLEWNTLTGNTYHTNGTFFRGALVFNTIMSLPAQVTTVSLWLNLETQRMALKTTECEIRSLALFHIFDMARPVFHTLAFRKRLQGEIIAMERNHLITKTVYGYQVILTNTIAFDPELTVDENLFSIFKKKVVMKINNISSGLYQIKHFLLDQKNGALYWQIEQMKSKLWWDTEVIEYLNLRSIPKLNISDKYIDGEWLTINDLDINAIAFYELRLVH